VKKISDFGRNILHHVISSSSSFSSSNFSGPRLSGGTSVRGGYVFCWVKIVFNLLNSYSIDAYNILVRVGIAGYVVAPLYKYMWTYLAIDRIHT
jgi:hypothetical protein